MAVPNFIITALANLDHFREEAQLGSLRENRSSGYKRPFGK